MFGLIRSRGLRISAELHEKIASFGEPINRIDSEVIAVRKVRCKRAPIVVIGRDHEYKYECVHAYGS